MKRDTRVLVAGLVLLASGIVTTRWTEILQASPDSAQAIDNTRDHWLAITSMALLFLGSLGVCSAAAAFCARLAPEKLCFGGLAFLAPAALYWIVERSVTVHSYDWVFLLIPWIVAIFSGGLMFLIGAMKLIAAKVRT